MNPRGGRFPSSITSNLASSNQSEEEIFPLESISVYPNRICGDPYKYSALPITIPLVPEMRSRTLLPSVIISKLYLDAERFACKDSTDFNRSPPNGLNKLGWAQRLALFLSGFPDILKNFNRNTYCQYKNSTLS